MTEPSLLRRTGTVFASIPVLAGAFVVVTLLAMGPLQGLDHALDGAWIQRYLPWLAPFAMHVADRVASQPVNLPVLLVAAAVIARRARSPRPLVLAAGAEAGFYAAGVLKIAFARLAPALDDPSFFTGGLWDVGRTGVSYPSGHAVEAVLVYGTVLYLLHAYTGLTSRVLHRLRILWVAVIANCVVVSFGLGYHWVTDLVGGVLFGALALRVLITLDQRWPDVLRWLRGEEMASSEPGRLVTH